MVYFALNFVLSLEWNYKVIVQSEKNFSREPLVYAVSLEILDILTPSTYTKAIRDLHCDCRMLLLKLKNLRKKSMTLRILFKIGSTPAKFMINVEGYIRIITFSTIPKVLKHFCSQSIFTEHSFKTCQEFIELRENGVSCALLYHNYYFSKMHF